MIKKKIELGNMNIIEYLKTRIIKVSLITFILASLFSLTRGLVELGDNPKAAFIYIIFTGSYIIPFIAFFFKKYKVSAILFLTLFQLMLIAIQVVTLMLFIGDSDALDKFVVLIALHSVNFGGIIIIAGFIINKYAALIYGLIGVVDIIVMTLIIPEKLAGYLVSMLGPVFVVIISTFYFTGLLNSLLKKSAYETETSKKSTQELKKVIDTVTDSVESFKQATVEISNGTQDLAQRTNEQAASLEEITSSIEEVFSNIENNLSNTGESENTAKSIKGEMERLNESSNNMVEIVQTIESIAFETNLLALNAAIEAARAGEAGSGFAVVATQVKELSQRSAAQSREIREIIQENINKVSETLKLVEKINEIIKEISLSSTEQHEALKQISMAIEQLNEMTQQNAALVSEEASSSEEIASRAKDLDDLVINAKEKFVNSSENKTDEEDKKSLKPIPNKKSK